MDIDIDKTIKCILNVGEQLFEDNIKYETKFDNNQKQQLKQTMEQILKLKHQINLQNNILNTFINQIEQCSSDGKNFDQLNKYNEIDNLFEQKLEECNQQNQIDYNNNEDYQKLLEWCNDNNDNDKEKLQQQNDDIEMMESEKFTIPIDPICKTEINIPVRNKQCGHIYDKDNLFNLIRKGRTIKCPVTGCTNKNVTKNSVEEDSRLRILIEKARQ